MKNLSINNEVWIKLTAEGRKTLELYDAPVTKKGQTVKRKTMNGYTQFQLWEVMHIFGKNLFVGNTKIPFGTNIKIDEKDLLDRAPYTKRKKAK